MEIHYESLLRVTIARGDNAEAEMGKEEIEDGVDTHVYIYIIHFNLLGRYIRLACSFLSSSFPPPLFQRPRSFFLLFRRRPYPKTQPEEGAASYINGSISRNYICQFPRSPRRFTYRVAPRNLLSPTLPWSNKFLGERGFPSFRASWISSLARSMNV